jgi:hypothetical protein
MSVLSAVSVPPVRLRGGLLFRPSIITGRSGESGYDPGQTRVIFSPRLSDRRYTLQASTPQPPLSWITSTGATKTDDGGERTVTDLDASTMRKFYKAEITKQ